MARRTNQNQFQLRLMADVMLLSIVKTSTGSTAAIGPLAPTWSVRLGPASSIQHPAVNCLRFLCDDYQLINQSINQSTRSTSISPANEHFKPNREVEMNDPAATVAPVPDEFNPFPFQVGANRKPIQTRTNLNLTNASPGICGLSSAGIVKKYINKSNQIKSKNKKEGNKSHKSRVLVGRSVGLVASCSGRGVANVTVTSAGLDDVSDTVPPDWLHNCLSMRT